METLFAQNAPCATLTYPNICVDANGSYTRVVLVHSKPTIALTLLDPHGAVSFISVLTGVHHVRAIISTQLCPGHNPWAAIGKQWITEEYTPALDYNGSTINIRSSLHTITPSDEHTVYVSLGIEHAKHEEGFTIIPRPPRGGEPKTTMYTLIVLAIMTSPHKCLLGYEIAAIIKGNFYYYRNTPDSTRWLVSPRTSTAMELDLSCLQTRLFRTLVNNHWFQSLQAPRHLSPAERIWYIDYTSIRLVPLHTTTSDQQEETSSKNEGMVVQ